MPKCKSKFEIAIQKAPVVVIGIDISGKITLFNDAARRIFGFGSSDTIVGKEPGSIGGKALGELAVHFSKFISEKKLEREFKSVLDIESDMRRTFIWNSAFVYNENEAIEGIIGYGFDTTAQIEIEDELQTCLRQKHSLWSRLSMAEERERQRIASDLHDNIGQLLSLAKLKLGMLKQSIESEENMAEIDEIKSFIDESIKYTRSLIFEISTPFLNEIAPSELIESLCILARNNYGYYCNFSDDGEEKKVRSEVNAILFQSVRELLANISKYAGATFVEVRSYKDGDNIVVVVKDDGVGFDVDEALGVRSDLSGFGLSSIKERIEHFGGSMKIESGPKTGTEITLTAPVINTKYNKE